GVWSRTFARWVQRTSFVAAPGSSAGKRATPPSKHSAIRKTGYARWECSRSCISRRGLRQTAEPALTVSLRRLVNPGSVRPAAWTWTRGGWRGRYPDIYSHASCRSAWGYSDRIRTDCRPHRHCDDDRPVVAWRRRRRHVGQAWKYRQYV